MLQKEFEERVGFKVSASEYGTIETLYNESDLDKDSFCAKWKKNDRMEMAELNANTITTLNKRIFSKDAKIKVQDETIKQTAYFLIDKSDETDDVELYKRAVELIGRGEAVIYKLKNDYKMTDADKDFIVSEVQK